MNISRACSLGMYFTDLTSSQDLISSSRSSLAGGAQVILQVHTYLYLSFN
ncbi:hypothetical protein HKBW3S06_01386, partial [Candidatus Hakubella thermalkaliphila]